MIFIVPGTIVKYSKGAIDPLVLHSFPFGIAALASVLEKDRVNVKIINDGINPINKEIIKDLAIEECGRPVFGLTCLTLQVERCKQIHNMIKEVVPNAAVIVGGIHATSMPQEFIEAGFEYVFRGEGELVITDLVTRLSEGQDVSKIPGLIYKDALGHIRTNEISKEYIQLDKLPVFPFHLFEKDINNYDVGVVLTARGCPYKCIFCSQRIMTGVTYRSRPIELIMDEIDVCINKLSADKIFFIEDNFVVNRKHAVEVCNQIIKRGLNKKAIFCCQLRGDSATKEILLKLKEANFTMVLIGIETGSEKIAKIIEKGETVDANIKAVKLAKECGLQVSATFIIGFPQETNEDRLLTVKLATRLPLDSLRVNIAIPYPGTPMYYMAKDRLFIEAGWRNFNVVSSLVTGPFRSVRLPYIPEGTTEDELRYLSMWTNIKFWLKPISLYNFFTMPTTGVTRFPKNWYFQPIFYIKFMRLFTHFVLVGCWIIILRIKISFVKSRN